MDGWMDDEGAKFMCQDSNTPGQEMQNAHRHSIVITAFIQSNAWVRTYLAFIASITPTSKTHTCYYYRIPYTAFQHHRNSLLNSSRMMHPHA
jgi:hypothetical protein